MNPFGVPWVGLFQHDDLFRLRAFAALANVVFHALPFDELQGGAIADGTLIAVGESLSRAETGYWLEPGHTLSEPARDLIAWILAETCGSTAAPAP